MVITRRYGIAGARTAAGATVVIDVFRAFSAAAYAFAAGADRIILAESVAEAIGIAERIPGSLLMGEVNGVKPGEFDIGNSPGEIVADQARVSARTIVHRSSSGTRCARAALAAGAAPLFVASLVVVSATARAITGAERVTIIPSGIGGAEPADEDEICADVLTDLLSGVACDVPAAAARVAALERAEGLRLAPFTHPDDIALCTQADRFDFAMKVSETSDGMTLACV
jgi:2-phosphosulfolactate phosphatase